MRFLKTTIAIVILVLFLNVNAQTATADNEVVLNSEIGILVGPVFMQTDYLTSAFSEVGVDFGVVYIADLSPSRYKSKVFSWIVDHLKVRAELSFSNVKLEHDLDKVDGSELRISQFKGMKGDVRLFNTGLFIEWNFLSLTKNSLMIQPYFLTGISYTSADSSVSFDSSVGLPSIYTSPNGLFLEKNNVAISYTGGLGLRLRLTSIDLVAEGRFQSFLSDRIEGLDTNIKGNKGNDSQVLFKIGAIYSLN